ncbi:MAG TPA: Abi-alpha family protein [Candidatus Angelobacter sp.]|nr:Abi-alpha family protein [Candidatus Angelobacter sp.]
MADEDKLIKAGVEAALKPFADLLDKLAGPAAEEIGLTLKDHVRVFRLKRQIRLFERVKAMLADTDMEPERVPFKLLVPVVENASIEENDELQDRWAAMLANAAIKRDVHPSFPEILRQLSEKEVLYLDACYEYSEGKRQVNRDKVVPAIRRTERYRELDKEFFFRLGQCLGVSDKSYIMTRSKAERTFPSSGLEDNVIRLGLMHASTKDLKHRLTHFGTTFVKSCRHPCREDHRARSMSSSE